MMKIIQVNCVYARGSTGKIVQSIHNELQKQGIGSVVCYGRGQGRETPYVHKFCKEIEANIHTLVIRSGLILNYGGNTIPTRRLIRLIKKENPNVVHVHCINGSCVNVYRLLRYLAKQHIKTVVTHHAEFYYTGSCEHAYDCKQFMDEEGCRRCPIKFHATRSLMYDNSHRAWVRMRKAFSQFDFANIFFTAVSPWLKERSQLSPIVRNYSCKIIMNGVDTSVFTYKREANTIRKSLHTECKQTVLFVSAHFNPLNKEDNKGGWYVMELAKQMPEILFVVVALRSEVYDGLPENLYLWGASSGQEELASLYRSADVTILTSRRETFSMVCAESLCCGTPVVGFLAGGPESIAIKEYSSFVEYGDLVKLKEALYENLGKRYNPRCVSEMAQRRFSVQQMTQKYISIYKDLVLR